MCHVCYYNNSDATFCLLISGDINPNPGPVSASTAGKINWFVMNANSLVLGASDTLHVTSGIPQGSILGAMLFLIYGNNLPDSVLKSHLAKFADDTKIYTQIKSQEDAAYTYKLGFTCWLVD